MVFADQTFSSLPGKMVLFLPRFGAGNGIIAPARAPRDPLNTPVRVY